MGRATWTGNGTLIDVGEMPVVAPRIVTADAQDRGIDLRTDTR
ncbi:hypothetical protein [Streptomyces sp. NPDC004270]